MKKAWKIGISTIAGIVGACGFVFTMQRFAKYIANAMEKDMMKDIHLDFIKGS